MIAILHLKCKKLKSYYNGAHQNVHTGNPYLILNKVLRVDLYQYLWVDKLDLQLDVGQIKIFISDELKCRYYKRKDNSNGNTEPVMHKNAHQIQP